MRVVIVGLPDERLRLREQLAPAADVVAEFRTVAAARAAAIAADAMLVAAPSGKVAHADHEPLTRREMDVIELLVEGLSNKGIAARLSISDQTVKFHVAAICGKLGAVNRTDAVRRALTWGLVA